ncbi:MAG: DNA primase [Alphaproteobacteria bacterium]|nr:DNA primase [Alphaproteobacteria bacterium]
MRYGEGLLEEIRRRTDLVQLVGRRVKLVRKGRVMWGCCPFHAEKSPSFKVENERRTYKCFGCGKGGDCFRWLTETEGMSFPEAVEKLAAEAGVELPRWSPEDEAREQKKKSLYDIVELAARFYEAQLMAPEGRPARDYLKGRGLDGAAARQFRLGYAPPSSGMAGGQALVAHLTGHNVTRDDMIAAGLARPAEEGRPMRDFFFNRVMFTITDSRGRPIAFGGRALEADAKPKYINTGETVLFSKGHNLYNFPTARAAAIKTGTIILAEGYMDVIALVRAGFSHAVAPLGTALTEDQLGLLWRTAPEPILAFDGDAAGLKAAHRAAHLALPHLKPGHSLRFAFLPPGEDPDSFLAANGSGAMQMLLEAAIPLSQLLWRAETEGKDFSTPERRAGLEQALGALVGQIGDTKVADYYRRGFDQMIFENFKRRSARPGQDGARSAFRPQPFRGRGAPLRPQPGTAEAVSPGVQSSALVRKGVAGARQAKETELGRLLAAEPQLALWEGETLAGLDVADPSLDRLRHELLNLAASGSSLEKVGVQTHFARKGMAELLARFAGAAADDAHASFQRAAFDLRQLVGGESGQSADARRLLERRKALSQNPHPGNQRPDDGRGNI